MIDREQAREVLAADEPATKLWLYAGNVRAIHERVTPLATLLAQAGPEGAAVLATGEQERRVSVRFLVDHLADLGAGADRAQPGPAHAAQEAVGSPTSLSGRRHARAPDATSGRHRRFGGGEVTLADHTNVVPRTR